MPEEGINYVQRSDLLSFEELLRLLSVLSKMGISKVRMTGGEPFLRKEFLYFLKQVSRIQGIDQIHITSNGTLLEKYLPDLWELGIHSINLSLDCLEGEKVS